MNKKYDVAAYIWPAYCKDERTEMFWPKGIGEWESVMSNRPKFTGHVQPRRPLWGYVNEADPYVMETEINAAADNGVNVFIYDWYWYDRRPFLEGCLNEGYLKAKNNDRVKFYLMWANHNASTTWDKRISDNGEKLIWYGSQDRTQFEIICNRLLERYFIHPSYYQIDGKPVFMIYDLDTLIQGLGGVKKTRAALDWFRKQVEDAGFKGLYLQCTLRKHLGYNVTGIAGDNVGSQQDIIEYLGFDSVTHYQFCHFVDIDRDYESVIEDVKKEWDILDTAYSIPYNPHVSVGWDNNPRFNGLRNGIITSNEPEKFEKALQMAKDYIDSHPEQARLITVNSWNEWTESSYLQPDDVYGYGYLNAIKHVFG